MSVEEPPPWWPYNPATEIAFDKKTAMPPRSKSFTAQGLRKNPTMQGLLERGQEPRVRHAFRHAIYDHDDPEAFRWKRRGPGWRHVTKFELVDDWVEVADREWRRLAMDRQWDQQSRC